MLKPSLNAVETQFRQIAFNGGATRTRKKKRLPYTPNTNYSGNRQ